MAFMRYTSADLDNVKNQLADFFGSCPIKYNYQVSESNDMFSDDFVIEVSYSCDAGGGMANLFGPKDLEKLKGKLLDPDAFNLENL